MTLVLWGPCGQSETELCPVSAASLETGTFKEGPSQPEGGGEQAHGAHDLPHARLLLTHLLHDSLDQRARHVTHVWKQGTNMTNMTAGANLLSTGAAALPQRLGK